MLFVEALITKNGMPSFRISVEDTSATDCCRVAVDRSTRCVRPSVRPPVLFGWLFGGCFSDRALWLVIWRGRLSLARVLASIVMVVCLAHPFATSVSLHRLSSYDVGCCPKILLNVTRFEQWRVVYRKGFSVKLVTYLFVSQCFRS